MYNTSEIEGILNKKSTNYVKYIFWISLAEFLFFIIVGICFIFLPKETIVLLIFLEKLGRQMNDDVEMNFEHLFIFALKVFSLLITMILFFFLQKLPKN